MNPDNPNPVSSRNGLNITLIGCGKMGGALLHRWLDKNIIDKAQVAEPKPIDADLLSDHRVYYQEEVKTHLRSDILVLAIKPQILADVCASLKPFLSPDTVILSIAAGQTLSCLEKIFGASQPIIRSMPNTPAAIGKGITAAIPNGAVTGIQMQQAEILLSSAGIVLWIDSEGKMDAVTALSGSGPAYVFYLIEALTKAGEAIGLSPLESLKLARQTVIGSAALAEQDPLTSAEDLRRNVTSPNGTTEAGLKILMDGRMQSLITETLGSAKKRSIELQKSKK